MSYVVRYIYVIDINCFSLVGDLGSYTNQVLFKTRLLFKIGSSVILADHKADTDRFYFAGIVISLNKYFFWLI